MTYSVILRLLLCGMSAEMCGCLCQVNFVILVKIPTSFVFVIFNLTQKKIFRKTLVIINLYDMDTKALHVNWDQGF